MIVDQIGCSGSSFVVAVGAFVAIARDAAVAVSMSLQLLSLSATVSVVDQRRLEKVAAVIEPRLRWPTRKCPKMIDDFRLADILLLEFGIFYL